LVGLLVVFSVFVCFVCVLVDNGWLLGED